MRQRWSRVPGPCAVILLLAFAAANDALAYGFAKEDLQPVQDSPGGWALKIVIFDVGQADAILLLAPNGDAVLIDAGDQEADGTRIANYLKGPQKNGVGILTRVKRFVATHYDADHIRGLPALVAGGIAIDEVLDQGPSRKRSLGSTSVYGNYVRAVGDPNGNGIKEAGENGYIRSRMEYGHTEHMGQGDEVEIRCVAVRGDTKGGGNDVPDLDPSDEDIDENPGSIALLVSVADFEFYTAGDQTDNDWKAKPAVEESVVNSEAIPDGGDIDVLKVSHHGSDTSTSQLLASTLYPEVAVVSTTHTTHNLPKKVALKQLEDNEAIVLITGNGKDPSTGKYPGAQTSADDGYDPSPEAVFNRQGDVVILVAPDGKRYTVRGRTYEATFSPVDSENFWY